VMVLNGTGAQQVVRVVQPGVNTTASPTNRTWIVDRPFSITPSLANSTASSSSPPSDPSFVEIMPFRGRNIFHRDYIVDTGPFQYYGHGVESLANYLKMERVRGVMAWGQWRGWVPPPPVNESISSSSSFSSSVGFQGAMGNGLQPNLHNTHRGVHFLEGNHLVNYACGQQGYVEFWGGAALVLYPISALGNNITGSPLPVNVGGIYRDTVTDNNGGFYVGNGSSDIIIEGSRLLQSGSIVNYDCIIMGTAVDLIFTNNNTCT
jgi:hypothetical protein